MAVVASKIARGDSIPYTPSGADVAAGAVVVMNKLIGVATTTIKDGVPGALDVEGIFDFPKATGSSTAIDRGKVVYWDVADAEAKEDAESAANERLGIVTVAAADGDATVRVKLDPA